VAGIVSGTTFLGPVTRVAILLSGDTTVVADMPTAAAATLTPGAAVEVALPTASPVLVTTRP
jgi:hypothetical protein